MPSYGAAMRPVSYLSVERIHLSWLWSARPFHSLANDPCHHGRQEFCYVVGSCSSISHMSTWWPENRTSPDWAEEVPTGATDVIHDHSPGHFQHEWTRELKASCWLQSLWLQLWRTLAERTSLICHPHLCAILRHNFPASVRWSVRLWSRIGRAWSQRSLDQHKKYC